MRTLVIVATLIAGLTAPVWAGECPRRLAALDEQMHQHGSILSPDQAAKVKELREQAQRLHEAGKHGESLQAVEQAHRAMGM